MREIIDTVVIGAGQAGLSASYYLTQSGREHLVLERSDKIASKWSDERWDSFTIVTPNSRTARAAHMPYRGNDPDGYMSRDELVAFFHEFADSFRPPIRYGERVVEVNTGSDGSRFLVQTESNEFVAQNVIVAAGMLDKPMIPNFSRDLPPHMTQLHTSQYKNPAQLPPGSVLVVGTGQSGCQVADELCESGRRIFLSVGSNGRVPRRYRGKDCYVWVGLGGLNTKAGKYSNHAHVSGKDGGKNMNLHQFALDGIVLLSRIQGVENGRLLLGSDLYERLENADRAAKEFMQTVDAYIEREGIDAPPPDPPPELSAGFQQELLSEVDLAAENITSVIWATGFTFDLGWVKFDVLDSRGFPDQRGRGVTNVSGLYFVGYSWEFQPKSVFVGSAGGEAEFVVNHIEKDG